MSLANGNLEMTLERHDRQIATLEAKSIEQATTLGEQDATLRRIDSLTIRSAALLEIVIARLEAWTDDDARAKVGLERRVKAIESRLAREHVAHAAGIQRATAAAERAESTARNAALSAEQAADRLSAPDLTEVAKEARGFAMALAVEDRKARVEWRKGLLVFIGAAIGAGVTFAGYFLKR